MKYKLFHRDTNIAEYLSVVSFEIGRLDPKT